MAHALRELGGEWQQRAVGRAILWQAQQAEWTTLPFTLRLAPARQGEQCRLSIEAPGVASPNGALLFVVEKVVQALRRQGVEIVPLDLDDPDAAPAAHYVSPDSAPYAALVPSLETILKHHGLQLHHTATQRALADEISETLAGADLVIGPWETPQGRAALQGARTQGRPMLALALPGTSVPQWVEATATYGDSRTAFLANLEAALWAEPEPVRAPASRALFDTPPPAPALVLEPELPPATETSSLAIEAVSVMEPEPLVAEPAPLTEPEPPESLPEPQRARAYDFGNDTVAALRGRLQIADLEPQGPTAGHARSVRSQGRLQRRNAYHVDLLAPAPIEVVQEEVVQLPSSEVSGMTVEAVAPSLSEPQAAAPAPEPEAAPPVAEPQPAALAADVQPDMDERARIYREVALDATATPEVRFHAARVLAVSGHPEEAAGVFAAIVEAAETEELADSALLALGTLGHAARPALWRLDARMALSPRTIGVARGLTRAGDAQAALFRLEGLAQHEDESVRLAALQAMAEAGGAALPRFEQLATRAHDPKVRLEAARWLHTHDEAAEQVYQTLTALATQSERGDIAQAAVEMLGTLPGDAARASLLAIAHHAPAADARLAAAEAMSRQGDTGAARAVLLGLAQGTDDLAAGAALHLLASTPDTAVADTQQLMNTAILRSVRRRAALLLGQPHQPEAAQQAAARVLLALDRPDLARAMLARLTQKAEEIAIRRWAAHGLATIGEAALDDVRAAFAHADDPVVGQHLSEALLSHSPLAEDRRQAALWLGGHSNLPRAVEVLGDLALSARVSGSDAVQATDDLNRYATRWAGAARTLATLANDSPHPAVRARALDLLLREHPSELPLALLVDLAVTGSVGAADRLPVIQQLTALAQPAATRIVERLAADDTGTDGRWRLLHLMSELPDQAVGPALLQLSATAPQNRIRYIAAEQLIARGQPRAGYAALATIAIDGPDWILRERALYELAQGLPETAPLFRSIIARTRHQETYALARDLLSNHNPAPVQRVNNWMDDLVLRWNAWVAALPLGWLDRLMGKRSGEKEEGEGKKEERRRKKIGVRWRM